MRDLWTTWYGQLVFLAAISMIILGAKRVAHRVWPHGLRLLDFWPPFLIVFTHFLTLQATDSSLVPYEVLSLMILGIGLTLIEAVERGEILYWRFFKLYWRGAELLTLVVYILALGSHFFLTS
ncbi:DUF3397 domain-containing protein [Lactiplantibacillus plantarum]|nr:DUF3397 domain-containing protein [Lactiplantibacillus plantarum]MBO2706624.1 DUF3397 family protein [Lactiplantibacillus plantarum]